MTRVTVPRAGGFFSQPLPEYSSRRLLTLVIRKENGKATFAESIEPIGLGQQPALLKFMAILEHTGRMLRRAAGGGCTDALQCVGGT